MSLLPFVNQMAADADHAQGVMARRIRDLWARQAPPAEGEAAAVEGGLATADTSAESRRAKTASPAEPIAGGAGPSQGPALIADCPNVLAQLLLLVQACEIEVGMALQQTTAQIEQGGQDADAQRELVEVAATTGLGVAGAVALALACVAWLMHHTLDAAERGPGVPAPDEGKVPVGDSADATPPPAVLIVVVSRLRTALEMLARAHRAADQASVVAEIERIEQTLGAERRFGAKRSAKQPLAARDLMPVLDRIEMAFTSLGFRCRVEGPAAPAFAPLGPLLTRLRRTARFLRADLNDYVRPV